MQWTPLWLLVNLTWGARYKVINHKKKRKLKQEVAGRMNVKLSRTTEGELQSQGSSGNADVYCEKFLIYHCHTSVYEVSRILWAGLGLVLRLTESSFRYRVPEHLFHFIYNISKAWPILKKAKTSLLNLIFNYIYLFYLAWVSSYVLMYCVATIYDHI